MDGSETSSVSLFFLSFQFMNTAISSCCPVPPPAFTVSVRDSPLLLLDLSST